jgi:hypothetical protein
LLLPRTEPRRGYVRVRASTGGTGLKKLVKGRVATLKRGTGSYALLGQKERFGISKEIQKVYFPFDPKGLEL